MYQRRYTSKIEEKIRTSKKPKIYIQKQGERQRIQERSGNRKYISKAPNPHAWHKEAKEPPQNQKYRRGQLQTSRRWHMVELQNTRNRLQEHHIQMTVPKQSQKSKNSDTRGRKIQIPQNFKKLNFGVQAVSPNTTKKESRQRSKSSKLTKESAEKFKRWNVTMF